MRRISMGLIAGMLCAGLAPLSAQSVHDEITLTREQIETERQEIMTLNLQLSEAESKVFWPLYREYRGEMAALGDRFVKLLEDYATKYETLTDVDAAAMIDEMLSIQASENKIMARYAGKMQKAVPAKTVARCLQIENQLNHLLRALVADEIPLVKNK